MADPSPLDELDKSIVELFKWGDQKDYLKLYNKYAPAVYGVLLRTLDNGKMAQECLYASFVGIWAQRLTYDPAKERLFTWMLKIVKDNAKGAALENGKYLDDEIREEIDLVYATDIRKYLCEKRDAEGADFAAGVSTEIRTAIHLIYFEGLSFSAAATQLNLSVETLRGMMIKTIKQLKGAVVS